MHFLSSFSSMSIRGSRFVDRQAQGGVLGGREECAPGVVLLWHLLGLRPSQVCSFFMFLFFFIMICIHPLTCKPFSLVLFYPISPSFPPSLPPSPFLAYILFLRSTESPSDIDVYLCTDNDDSKEILGPQKQKSFSAAFENLSAALREAINE